MARRQVRDTRATVRDGRPTPSATETEIDGAIKRVVLHQSAVALAESSVVSPSAPLPQGYEERFQVVLPYSGLFSYRTGSRTVTCDSNQLLFVRPGVEFVDVHPVANLGHASVIITPDRQVLDEVCGPGGATGHAAFADGSRLSTASTHVALNSILQFADRMTAPIEREEIVISALLEALQTKRQDVRPARKVVMRAKEVIHAHANQPLTLRDVAADVGVNAAYLTEQFTLCEGMPLFRYILRLRLARALRELPHCESLTDLALSLGFSSHSHFSFAFRKAFGMSPSRYQKRSLGLVQLSALITSGAEQLSTKLRSPPKH